MSLKLAAWWNCHKLLRWMLYFCSKLENSLTLYCRQQTACFAGCQKVTFELIDIKNNKESIRDSEWQKQSQNTSDLQHIELLRNHEATTHDITASFKRRFHSVPLSLIPSPSKIGGPDHLVHNEWHRMHKQQKGHSDDECIRRKECPKQSRLDHPIPANRDKHFHEKPYRGKKNNLIK